MNIVGCDRRNGFDPPRYPCWVATGSGTVDHPPLGRMDLRKTRRNAFDEYQFDKKEGIAGKAMS
ncbi:hypothetical protein [Methylorubrum populi]